MSLAAPPRGRFSESLLEASLKSYRAGTDRVVTPDETLARILPLAPAMGITRVANLTGLDVIGIPVVTAIRPNARGLAASQGKGLTQTAAKVSALMESIEGFHAERIVNPLRLGSSDELAPVLPLADASTISAGQSGPFLPKRRTLWIEGWNLVDGAEMWVPFDSVHTDFTYETRMGRPMFDTTSNGLASGNSLAEATSHALCELIERDATALWWALSEEERARTRVDLDTVDDPDCRTLLEALADAEMAVMVWETTSDVRIPSFLCDIAEPAGRILKPPYAAEGMGCHPRRAIALARAITEAVQSRLTLIAGSRDDMYRSDYRNLADGNKERLIARQVSQPAVRSFLSAPDLDHETVTADLEAEIDGLVTAGLDQVVVVDLSKPEFGVPVVRAVVPGFECYVSADRYVPGQRALHRSGAAR